MSVAERASQLLERGGFPERLRKSALAGLVECNPSHVTRLLQRGVIPEAAVVGQMVDVRLALQGIVRATDPARAEVPAPAPSLLDQPKGADVLPSTGSFADVRARKELAAAQYRELELEERAGRLVEKDAVARAIEDQVRQIVTTLLQIGPRLGEQLAAESDPNRCRQIVDHAIKAELESLTRGLHDYVDGLEVETR